MKKTLLTLSLLTLFLVGCGNKEVKEEKQKVTPVETKAYKDYPDWVFQPDYKGGIAAVGQAKVGQAGLAFARQEALAMARGELSRMIEVQVDDMFKNYVNSVGVGGQDGVEKVSTSISRQVSSVAIQGSKQVNYWMNKEGTEVYVLVAVANDDLKKQTLDTVKTTLGNDQALWQEFKSQKAQDELDAAVNKKFK